MPKLGVHTKSGHLVVAPIEAWLVAMINSMPDAQRVELFRQVSALKGAETHGDVVNGASILPDKYLIGEDELGTITMVEKPVVTLGGG